MRSLLKTGDIFGAEFDYHTLPDELDKFDVSTFDESPMEFYAVCTDLVTGEPVYKLLMHHGYEFNEWIRASAPCLWPQESLKWQAENCLTAA